MSRLVSSGSFSVTAPAAATPRNTPGTRRGDDSMGAAVSTSIANRPLQSPRPSPDFGPCDPGTTVELERVGAKAASTLPSPSDASPSCVPSDASPLESPVASPSVAPSEAADCARRQASLSMSPKSRVPVGSKASVEAGPPTSTGVTVWSATLTRSTPASPGARLAMARSDGSVGEATIRCGMVPARSMPSSRVSSTRSVSIEDSASSAGREKEKSAPAPSTMAEM